MRSITSKAIIVNLRITDNNLDVIGLTEWLKPDEFTVLNEASPPGYTSDHILHSSRRGGGVAKISVSKFQQKTKTTVYSSFEFVVVKSMQPTQSLFIANVYRPPGPYSAFLTEIPEFLSDHVVMADNIHIFGD